MFNEKSVGTFLLRTDYRNARNCQGSCLGEGEGSNQIHVFGTPSQRQCEAAFSAVEKPNRDFEILKKPHPHPSDCHLQDNILGSMFSCSR